MNDPSFAADRPALNAVAALDRMSPRRGDMSYLAELLAQPQTRVLVLIDEKPVIRSNPERTAANLALFNADALADFDPDNREGLMFLGARPETGYAIFALALSPEAALHCDPEGSVLAPAVDLRTLAMQGVLSDDELALAATAVALAHWHAETIFCGRCGQSTRMLDGGWKRDCEACGHAQFPRTDPVVIMLPTAGDRCVLARQPQFPDGMMSAIAGFLEPGESIESAVARETAEEIGLAVTRVDYVQSQPWPFPHSLMIGASAEVSFAPLRVDLDELAQARWFDRDEARQILEGHHPHGLWAPGRHAIAHWLLRRFVERGA